MDNDKKYSAKEAAIAVLKKAGEMLQGSKLAKVEVHIHEGEKGVHKPSYSNENDKGRSEAGDVTRMASHNKNFSSPTKRGLMNAVKDEHSKVLNESRSMPKPNLPKSEGAENTDQAIEHQQSPEANPHEEKEGNNPEWGNEPGHYKLAKFCGHIGAKRKMRS